MLLFPVADMFDAVSTPLLSFFFRTFQIFALAMPNACAKELINFLSFLSFTVAFICPRFNRECLGNKKHCSVTRSIIFNHFNMLGIKIIGAKLIIDDIMDTRPHSSFDLKPKHLQCIEKNPKKNYPCHSSTFREKIRKTHLSDKISTFR